MIRMPHRPNGPRPQFVEDFIRVDATQLLAKTRGSPTPSILGPVVPVECLRFVSVLCRDDAGQLRRTLTLEVTWSRQPLGGWRGWWRCPFCRRRCGVLLMVDARSPIACRRCWQAQYTSGYPARQQQARLRDGLLRGAGESPAIDQEFTMLCARRRRGVRRGRRVVQRAVRMLAAYRREALLAMPVCGSRPS